MSNVSNNIDDVATPSGDHASAPSLDPGCGGENTCCQNATRGMPVRRILTGFVVSGALALAGCSGVAGSSSPTDNQAASANAAPETGPNAGFARFIDIPMPTKNSIDLDRTLVFGTERDWIGRVWLSSSMGVGEMYDFYKREMPRFGWSELTSVRSATSVLSYQMDNRIATIQVVGQRFGGSTVEFWMNPRAGTGASSTMGSSGGFGGGPVAAPRGAVEQAPLPQRR